MNTVAFFGSARLGGYTKMLLDAFLSCAQGDVWIVDAYRRKDIAPCRDCRCCWKERGCAIRDGMTEIYEALDGADVVAFASPMYFHGVPGPMKTVLDRLQPYWAGRRRGDRDTYKEKKAALLLTGGAPAFDGQFDAGEATLRGVCRELRASLEGTVLMPDTDAISPQTLKTRLDEARRLARKIYAD